MFFVGVFVLVFSSRAFAIEPAVLILQQRLHSQHSQHSQVALSAQNCAPDGYIKVVAGEGLTKNDRGQFKYCLKKGGNSWVPGACEVWGGAEDFIKAKLERTDITYTGMGVSEPDLFLFYCMVQTTK